MRAVARIPHPSTRAATIWTRLAVLSTFAILDIMRERSGKVTDYFQGPLGSLAPKWRMDFYIGTP